MDRDRALHAFTTYVAGYDPQNPRIALKVAHTLRVASLCERIARAEGLGADDVDRAWLLGLLHDIGRFEQVRRYDTFNDAASVSHAALGVEVLFGEGEGAAAGPLVRLFADACDDELVRLAVGTHSDYRLPEGLDERTHLFCNILRDADKVDILKVNCLCPIRDIYGISEQTMRESQLSPTCEEVFYQHRCIPRGIRRFPADIMLGHICFAWELVCEESRAIVREQGHLASMLSRTWEQPETQAAFDRMREHMGSELHLW